MSKQEVVLLLDNAKARAFWAGIIEPIARFLIKFKISPDAVTITGACLSVAVSFIFIPANHLLVGAVLLGICSLSDLVDGTMARQLGKTSKWGAFLDSTLDRVVDASILISIALYFAKFENGDSMLMAATYVALIAGQLTSYIRARAESLGAEAKIGVAERAERMLVLWLAILATGIGYNALPFAIYLLAVISVVTVLQRMLHVRKQLAG